MKTRQSQNLIRCAVIIIGAILFGCRKPAGKIYQSQSILQEYNSYVRSGILAVSPDGRWLLENANTDNRELTEGLVVREISTGVITHTISSGSAFLRIRWSPDSRTIAYFIQEPESGRRRLFFWDLAVNRQREVSIPPSFAQAEVRWSPNGDRLAFINDRGGLVIVSPRTDTVLVFSPDSKIRSFDWSRDSLSLATLVEGSTPLQSITFVDAGTGRETARISSQTDMDLRQVAWQQSAGLLLLAKSMSGEPARWTLSVIEPGSGREERLVSTSVQASEPGWLPEGVRFYWHESETPARQRIMVASHDGRERRPIELEGASAFREFLPAQNSMVVAQVSPVVNRWVLVKLEGNTSITTLAEKQGAKDAVESCENVSIRSADNVAIPLLVARTSKRIRGLPMAWIRITPRDFNVFGNWSQTQLELNHGMHVIQVLSREGHGADDVLAACDYARNILQVPRENIVVLGSSDGATVAIQAALRRPESMGMLALIGVIPSGFAPQHSKQSAMLQDVRVFAFHGENDRKVQPPIAREYLENLFGADAILPPRGLWHVFPGQPHALAGSEPHAAIHATIFRELGLIESDR